MNTSTSQLTATQLRQALRDHGLASHPICLHSSFCSFGGADGGPEAVIDSFLEEGCTLVVPTFSWNAYAAPPPPHTRTPSRNGFDYFLAHDKTPAEAPADGGYRSDTNEIDSAGMGIIPTTLLQRPARVRGEHPLCSFSALGPLADELVAGQTYENVFAPLEGIAEAGGAFLLAGVGLNRLTAIHLAEQKSGRRMFVRWAHVDGNVVAVRVGGCSEGFERLSPSLAACEQRTTVGRSTWRYFEADELLRQAGRTISSDPEITTCSDATCLRCIDAVAGGPDQ